MKRTTRAFPGIASLLIPLTCLSQGQPKALVTLSGYVVDATTAERLAGASLTYENSIAGVISNQYGFFSLTNQRDSARKVQVTFIGYATKELTFSFEKDSVMTIPLLPQATTLNEIAIETEHYGGAYSYAGDKVSLSGERIRNISSFGGEPDVLKSLQFLPGVQSGNEGTANISVRGGSYDQNLILLDEAPVYNASHALSFFSIFNTDAVHSVDFYRSSIPLKYGGRLSSVIDIRMKEGNRERRETRGSIGVVSSRLTTEGPLSKNAKWSYMLSGRYSYAGQVVNGIYFLGSRFLNDPTANRSTTDNRIHFYDLNAKINFDANDKNRFFLSTYSGHDGFYFNHITSGYDLAWGNNTLTLRWNHVYSKKLFSNTTLINSHYDYQYRLLNNTQYFLWSAELNEQQVKQDYDWYISNFSHVSFGWGFQQYDINPGQVQPRNDAAASSPYELDHKNALSANVYLSCVTKIGKALDFTYGIRYSSFGLTGKRTEYLFNAGQDYPMDSVVTSSPALSHALEPRASVKYFIGRNTFSFSYDRTAQFLQLLSNSSVGLPTDVWWPSSRNIKPQFADIFVASFARKVTPSLQFDLATFYKALHNVVDFKDNAKLFLNKYVESQLLQGRGMAYGFEVFIARTRGRLTGSLSYTYSKAFSQIEGVNNGARYPNRYDKRHNASVMLQCALSERLRLNSNFVLTSGGALTVPVGSFYFDNVSFDLYSKRNGYRLPIYHRLDVSLQYANDKKNAQRKFRYYWSFDIYNVYGRRNPFTVYSAPDDYGFVKTDTHALFLFRVVPTLSFNFAF